MNGHDLAGALADLEAADLARLREIWRARWGPPPPLRSVGLLRLMLAWRIQAEAFGGLDRKTRRALAARGTILPDGRDLGDGTILRRRWQGRTVEVVVGRDGFRWDGRDWQSLSAIAREITGTRQNGPRFFGLREHGAPADRPGASSA